MKFYVFLLWWLLIPTVTFSQTFEYDSSTIHPFLDNLIEDIIEDQDIAGATFALVHNGELKYLQGYGYVDVENLISVNPEKHLFRIGSISKMFVWTAIMQLYEQGKLELDDDIRNYLDLNIPETYTEPITILNLMTHTPGFEDLVVGLFAKDSTALAPLKDILAVQMPKRVAPPGYLSAYSNHGTGMAQLIVENITGKSFYNYVKENIFDPLEMNNSTFYQPARGRLSENVSKGYVHADEQFYEKDFEYIPLYGVGGASATSMDMAKFMIAHLQEGSFNETKILDSATAILMQSPAFYNHPKANPMRHGFMDVSQNGKILIGHGGDTGWFHSFMGLFPEEELGFFISFNSQNGGAGYFNFLARFTDFLFPEELESITPAISSEELKKNYAGFYASNRYPHSRITKLMRMATSSDVSVTEEGLLKTNFLGQQKEWIALDDVTFRDKTSSDLLLFSKDVKGDITHLFIGTLPVFAFSKLSSLENPMLHIIIFLALVVASIVCGIFWPIVYALKGKKSTSDDGRGSRIIAWSLGVSWLLFFAIMIVGVAIHQIDLLYHIPSIIGFALLFPIVTIPLVLIMGLQVYKTWSGKLNSLTYRIIYTFLFFIFVDGLLVMNYWNLLGFKY